jgi:hypothetical protein
MAYARTPAHGALALGLITAIMARAQCLPPSEIEGHPLFASLFQRVDQEGKGGGIGNGIGTSVAFGDLDGDGDDDAVVACNLGGLGGVAFVSVLINEGGGVYAFPQAMLTGFGWETNDVALADFDADGDLDIGAANGSNSSVSVFLNNGDATFADQVVYPVGEAPRSLIAGDLDADGVPDLAVLNTEDGAVSLLFGHGDGTFAPQILLPVGAVSKRAFPLSLAVPGPFMRAADLDGDADLDLVIPGVSQITIAANDGAGHFTLAAPADVIGASANDIVVADLNDDGLPDLGVVMTKPVSTSINVLINEGGLTFAPPATYSAEFFGPGCPSCDYFMRSIDAGDIDADGAPDLMVGHDLLNSVVLSYHNNGDGTFAPFEIIPAFETSWVVRLYDTNADGHLDATFLSRSYRPALRTYLGDDGHLLGPEFFSATGVPLSGKHWRVADADLDADGDVDVVTVRRDTTIERYRGNGDGTFEVLDEIEVPADALTGLTNVTPGDLNGDGLPDLVLPDAYLSDLSVPGRIWTLLNTGDFTFEPLTPIELPDARPQDVALGDLDGDGDLDAVAWLAGTTDDGLAPADRRILVMRNDASGTLTPVQQITYASQIVAGGDVDLGDVDGDGDLDAIAVAGPQPTNAVPSPVSVLAIFTNDGTGTLSLASQSDVGILPIQARLLDLDNDADLDLAIFFNHNGATPEMLAQPYLTISLNDGRGNFTLAQQFIDINTSGNGQLVAADFDGDGSLDLGVPNQTGSVRIHLNHGDASFGPGVNYTSIESCQAIAGADVDSDGRPDLLIASTSIDGIVVLRNRSCSCPADINADGMLNILDFVAFQLLWQAADQSADCDASMSFTILDFVCFQQLFQQGCP